jgi:hypothetical protein
LTVKCRKTPSACAVLPIFTPSPRELHCCPPRCPPFASIKLSLSRRAYMDRWLNNAPALAFIKDLSTWLIINSRCEPILWSDDDKELAWLFACVLECGANNQTKLIVKNGRAKNLGEVAVRRTSRAGIQRSAVVLPIRSA